MAIFVLVHGGGHGGWCYKFVAERLRAAGHLVYAPSLTGLGEREHLLSPDIDLNTHITDVVKLLEFEDLRDVILVGHSYGGMVITGIADRATDRIRHLIYLDAANPLNGQSLLDVAPMIAVTRQLGKTINGIELVLFPGDDPLGFFGVTDPDMQAWMKTKLTPHPWKCFDTPLHLHNEDSLWALPQTHIICTSTLEYRLAFLKGKHAERIWDIDTGHDLMITEPDKVTEMFLKVAAL